MSLTLDDIHTTAQAVVSLLTSSGIISCLVGSAAGSAHGISRIPNVGPFVATTHQRIYSLASRMSIFWFLSGSEAMSPAEIKNLLVSKDSRFFLEKPATNPIASYSVLKYRLTSEINYYCHVDIFLPGMIHLPAIPPSHIVYSAPTGLPIMPFLPVLLHKVQAWIAHRASPKGSARIKQSNDVQDIDELLIVAVKLPKIKLEEQSWLPDWFLQEAVQGISNYIEAHPDTTLLWQEIGFLRAPNQIQEQ